MKSKLYFTLLMLTLFTATLASAAIDVTYEVLEGTINLEGELVESNTGVINFNVDVYTCLDNPCETVGEYLFGGSSSGNEVTISLPNELIEDEGYLFYFYKEGYIGWEQRNIRIQSPNNLDLRAPNPVYLSKKELAWAPIVNLSVANEIEPNKPVTVGVTTLIDSDTYSAIEDNRVSNVPLKEDVETKVTLEIFNSNGDLFYTEETTVFIPYSESIETSFTFNGFTNSDAGDYEFKVSTEVTDSAVLNQISQSTSSNTVVILPSETNYAFTLINGLNLAPLLPEIDELVTFSFEYSSGYVDENEDLSSLDTTATINFYKDNNLISSNTEDLSSSTYTFSRTFSEVGNYRVEVIGTAKESDIPGSSENTYSSSQELIFIIAPSTNTGGNETGGNETNETTNTAPTLDPIGNKEVNEESLLRFDVTASDSEDDDLTFSIIGDLPLGATFENEQFSWRPSSTQSGVYTLAFVVRDGEFSDSEIIQITVINIEDEDDDDDERDRRSSGSSNNDRQSISLQPLSQEKSSKAGEGLVLYSDSTNETTKDKKGIVAILSLLILITILIIILVYILKLNF